MVIEVFPVDIANILVETFRPINSLLAIDNLLPRQHIRMFLISLFYSMCVVLHIGVRRNVLNDHPPGRDVTITYMDNHEVIFNLSTLTCFYYCLALCTLHFALCTLGFSDRQIRRY